MLNGHSAIVNTEGALYWTLTTPWTLTAPYIEHRRLPPSLFPNEKDKTTALKLQRNISGLKSRGHFSCKNPTWYFSENIWKIMADICQAMRATEGVTKDRFRYRGYLGRPPEKMASTLYGRQIVTVDRIKSNFDKSSGKLIFSPSSQRCVLSGVRCTD